MFYHFKIRKEDVGFSAQCIELTGCIAEGDTKEELSGNMREALNLYLDENPASNVIHPLPDKTIKKDKVIVEIAPDVEIAFAVLLRHYRIQNKISQNEMAHRLEMKNIFSYQRLEKRANPTLSTLNKIKKAFPDFPVNCIFEC